MSVESRTGQQLTSRRALLLAAAAVGLALLALLVVPRLTGGAATDGPLYMGDVATGAGAGLDVGEELTYGSVIVSNRGAEPMVLDSVELHTDDSNAAVIDVRVLDVAAVPAGSLAGVKYGYEPPSAATDVKGTVLEPSSDSQRRDYQLIFGVRLDKAGETLFDEVEVRYRVGDKDYKATAVHQLQICNPHGVKCLAPPP